MMTEKLLWHASGGNSIVKIILGPSFVRNGLKSFLNCFHVSLSPRGPKSASPCHVKLQLKRNAGGSVVRLTTILKTTEMKCLLTQQFYF